MSSPAVPNFQKEGAASPCRIGGINLAWKNCTCLSAAMGMHKSSLGRVYMSGCAVREETNDKAGGTTLDQVQAVCSAHGVATEKHTGSNVASLWYLAYQAASGRGFILQGNTQPDGRGNVNHAVWVNHAIGGTPGDPTAFRVYDPWSNGPADWSYAKTKAFMLALRPYGEGDSRTLKSMGVNGGYALVFPDTEPHAHFKYGGTKTPKFPDKTRIDATGVYGHSRPSLGAALQTRPLPKDSAWWAYQHVTVNGVEWYGNHSGTEWVRKSKLRQVGGTT